MLQGQHESAQCLAIDDVSETLIVAGGLDEKLQELKLTGTFSVLLK